MLEAPTPHVLTYEATKTPQGVRSGSLAAANAKVIQMKAYIEQTAHAPIDPVALGLLEPKVAQKKKGTRDKTQIDESEGGDATLRDLATKARSKQVRREEEADGVKQRKEARLEKRRRRPTRRPRSCVQRSTSASRTAPAVWCHARTRRCSCARRAATSRSSSAARARVWQRASRCG